MSGIKSLHFKNKVLLYDIVDFFKCYDDWSGKARPLREYGAEEAPRYARGFA